jgi:hypothetical protein
MIFEKRGKFCFRDEKGKLHKFKTKAEAEKAAGGVVETEDQFDAIVPVAPLQEIEHGSEEEESNEETPSHYDWLQEEDLDSEE